MRVRLLTSNWGLNPTPSKVNRLDTWWTDKHKSRTIKWTNNYLQMWLGFFDFLISVETCCFGSNVIVLFTTKLFYNIGVWFKICLTIHCFFTIECNSRIAKFWIVIEMENIFIFHFSRSRFSLSDATSLMTPM